MTDENVFRFEGNNVDRVFVNGILNVAGSDKQAVYAKHRDVPLVEYVESALKELLFEVQNLAARDFDRILTGMREHLSNRNIQFVIVDPSDAVD